MVATMAATNKCLAQIHKTHIAGDATKKREIRPTHFDPPMRLIRPERLLIASAQSTTAGTSIMIMLLADWRACMRRQPSIDRSTN
jgi:hypothetical protein